MAQLSVYLPPFAGDYSGVCSALFDLDCLIVLCDAACCTRNYVDYDEPRWSRTKTTAMCAQLRTVEAVLGDDRRIIEQAVEAAKNLRPDLIALLGSPVPAIIGMDLPGMAREVEALSGVPTIGFDTTGFESYHRGVEMALCALTERFSEPGDTVPGSVNLLGLTPFDIGNTGGERAVRRSAERAGLTVLSELCMDYTLSDLRAAARAERNLVVTAAGLAPARAMREKYGIPYTVGMPLGENGVSELLAACPALPCTGRDSGDGILIVGEQVTSCSLRRALLSRGCTRPVTAAGFFEMDTELMLPGDIRLSGERALVAELRSGRYTTLIGDGLLARIPYTAALEHIVLPHPAISGSFGWDDVPVFASDDIWTFLDRIRLT